LALFLMVIPLDKTTVVNMTSMSSGIVSLSTICLYVALCLLSDVTVATFMLSRLNCLAIDCIRSLLLINTITRVFFNVDLIKLVNMVLLDVSTVSFLICLYVAAIKVCAVGGSLFIKLIC